MAKKTKGKKSGAATAAVALLTETNTPFQMREYEHTEGVTSFGEEAAKNLGASEEQVFKTLLIVHEKEFAVAIVPVSGKLNVKAAAAALGWKNASMCDPKVAERRTGYVVGGISPLGQKTPPHPPGRKRPAFRHHHGVRRQAWPGRRARPRRPAKAHQRKVRRYPRLTASCYTAKEHIGTGHTAAVEENILLHRRVMHVYRLTI